MNDENFLRSMHLAYDSLTGLKRYLRNSCFCFELIMQQNSSVKSAIMKGSANVRSGKASAVMQALHHSVVLKRELSRKAKLLVF